jgi:hypothetical protein
MFTPPVLKREPYTLPDGTDVEVRALLLTERLAVRRQVTELTAGKGVEESLVLMVPKLLAMSVELDRKPLMTAAQWDEYGASYPTETMELFNKSSDLSGFNVGAAEKN